MRRLRAFFYRMGGLFNKDRRDQEFARELEANLALHVEDNLRSGMTAEAARRAALIKLGGVELAKENYRDQRGLPLIDTIQQDLRYGWRMLLKYPFFTVIAVLTLALGIGANTAIFSVVNALVLQPLPYRDANRLVWLTESKSKSSDEGMSLSPPTFDDWRAQQQSLEGLSAFLPNDFIIKLGDEPTKITGAGVSANFFSLLGVAPALGRTFLPEDDQGSGEQVAVLSHELWRRLGADPTIVGKDLVVDGKSCLIVGVAPAQFDFPRGTLIWTPLSRAISSWGRARGAHVLSVIGRLKPMVTAAQAEAEFTTIQQRIAQTDDNYVGMGARVTSLQSSIVGDLGQILLVLLAAAGFVLLIACANVTSLLLTRATVRRREVAIRLALGATRGRLTRQLLTESLLLSLMGGVLGLLIALWGTRLLVIISPKDLPRTNEIATNYRVLIFAGLISICAGVICGLVPALQASNQDLSSTLKDEKAGLVGSRHRHLPRHLLIIGEIALTMVLLVGAGLMINSFIRLMRVDLGFNPSNVISFSFRLPASRYGEIQQRDFYRDLIERTGSAPGIQTAGLVLNLPATSSMTSPLIVAGHPKQKFDSSDTVEQAVIGPSYFRTMGIALISGRDINEQDTAGAPPIALINETLARRFFPNENPVGKRLRTLFGQGKMREVVGVVHDVKHTGPADETPAEIYVPYQQQIGRYMTIVVRGNADTATTIQAVRNVVRSLDRDLAIDKIATMNSLLADRVARPRFYLQLLGAFALLALMLAAIGIFGVVSYVVTQRTQEIGIRMALGAQTADILRLVVGQNLVVVLAGIGLGLLAAFGLTRLLASQLFGIRATDPLTFGLVSVFLLGVALAACLLPARRASRVDPTIALRCE